MDTRDATIVAYHLGEIMTPALRELYRLFDGDLVLALVLGELGQHSARQRMAIEKGIDTDAPYAMSNAYSLAQASGIPRETMRRKLEKLKALGWIRESENGGLSLNPDTVPPLAERFKDYNQTLLIRMRKSLQQLEGIAPSADT